MNMETKEYIFLLILIVGLIDVTRSAIFQPPDEYADDIQGPYCAVVGCCPSRVDVCTAPILDTLCYCDEFCNRTTSHDCCPDYWSHCLGLEPPTTLPPTTTRRPIVPPEEIRSCLHKGRNYMLNTTTKENCNECKCVEIPANNAYGKTLTMMCEENPCLVDNDIVRTVNDRSDWYGWSATNYSKFWGRTLDDGIKYRLGTLQPEKAIEGTLPTKPFYDPNALPREFDSKERWPRYISPIQDQEWCGSSWAISTSAVASDRFGIISKGLEEVRLSAQNILSCQYKGKACDGGRYDRAWNFVKRFGLVDEDCFPYVGANKTCRIGKKGNLKQTGCQTPRYGDRKGRYSVSPAYRLGNYTDIMYEILKSGPVQATIKVYHDFFHYRRGIYTHTDLSMHQKYGYHSVRILGWGEDFTSKGPKKYWKVANSWGTDWGEDGQFRIARGINECDIESFVLGVWPTIDKKIISLQLRGYTNN